MKSCFPRVFFGAVRKHKRRTAFTAAIAPERPMTHKETADSILQRKTCQRPSALYGSPRSVRSTSSVLACAPRRSLSTRTETPTPTHCGSF